MCFGVLGWVMVWVLLYCFYYMCYGIVGDVNFGLFLIVWDYLLGIVFDVFGYWL